MANLGARVTEVTGNVLPGLVREGDGTYLLPFAEYPDEVMLQVDVVDPDIHQLGDPDTCIVKK